MPKTVVIAGGTGLIGTRLLPMLQERGYTVRILTRQPKSQEQYAWSPSANTIDEKALVGADYIINLAGAGIADGRWTDSRKRELIDSRVQSAETIRMALSRMKHQPLAYVSASAIGYYGNTGEQNCLETDQPADDSFMPRCCEAWEAAAVKAGAQAGRTAILRIGIVLAKEGGALKEVAKPLYAGLGAYFDDGKAWWSWIHRDDMCRMLIWAMENEAASGIFNAVAPNAVRNYDLVKATAKAMGRSGAILLPTPAFTLRLALGEMSAVVLNSNLVSSEKVQKAGFSFTFDAIEGALADIFV
jgi:uncharacterized protein